MSAVRAIGPSLWNHRLWGWPALAVSAPLTLFNYEWPESLEWAIFTAIFNALVCVVFLRLARLRHAVPVACLALAVAGMLHVIAMAPIAHSQNRGSERIFTDDVVQRLKQSNSNPQP